MAGDYRHHRRRRHDPGHRQRREKHSNHRAAIYRFERKFVNKKTIVLAYSGGLDTSVLLKRFILEGHDVIALTADLGESDAVAGGGAARALQAVKEKALALGAREAVLVDAKQRFIDDFAFKALHANALYQGVYPLSAALARPLISHLLVETAHARGAAA